MRRMLIVLALSALATPGLACGAGPTTTPMIPRLSAGLEDILPKAVLTDAARGDVDGLRARMRALSERGDEAGARQTEEEAMRLLGYSKLWIRCGSGSFTWQKRAPAS